MIDGCLAAERDTCLRHSDCPAGLTCASGVCVADEDHASKDATAEGAVDECGAEGGDSAGSACGADLDAPDSKESDVDGGDEDRGDVDGSVAGGDAFNADGAESGMPSDAPGGDGAVGGDGATGADDAAGADAAGADAAGDVDDAG